MGLDMYIYNDDTEKVACWHKHYGIHDAVNTLARHKGLHFESFNCVPVRLEPGDIDFIKASMDDNAKDPETIALLSKCKFIIETGGNLTYDSSW